MRTLGPYLGVALVRFAVVVLVDCLEYVYKAYAEARVHVLRLLSDPVRRKIDYG